MPVDVAAGLTVAVAVPVAVALGVGLADAVGVDDGVALRVIVGLGEAVPVPVTTGKLSVGLLSGTLTVLGGDVAVATSSSA